MNACTPNGFSEHSWPGFEWQSEILPAPCIGEIGGFAVKWGGWAADVESMSRRRRSERGAVLVEAVFITPLLFIAIFAIFEYGLLIYNGNSTSNASRTAARSASVYGTDLSADFRILEKVEEEIDALGVDKVNYVVVYNITTIGDPMPSACHTSSVADVCNRYVPADFDRPLDDAFGNPTTDFRCGPIAVDRFWCPGDRETSLTGPPDLIGVYVNSTHTFATGFFGDTKMLEEQTVIRLEPDTTS